MSSTLPVPSEAHREGAVLLRVLLGDLVSWLLHDDEKVLRAIPFLRQLCLGRCPHTFLTCRWQDFEVGAE
jgi:hypothetical protein